MAACVPPRARPRLLSRAVARGLVPWPERARDLVPWRGRASAWPLSALPASLRWLAWREALSSTAGTIRIREHRRSRNGGADVDENRCEHLDDQGLCVPRGDGRLRTRNQP